MQYHKTIILKDGRACTLRNGTAEDGEALLKIFNLTHTQTDYLLTYPEEHSYTVEDEAELLRRKTDSVDEIEILAFVDGAIVGSAGVTCVARKEKTRHRAEFGISVDKAHWGLGIGRALTGMYSWSWRRSQRTKAPSPCTGAWASRSTAGTRRAFAPG